MNIRINAVPVGHTSLPRREALVGLGLSVVPEGVLKKNPPSEHDTSFSPTVTEGYAVFRADVIDALNKIGRHDDAEFWSRVATGHYMIFSADGCAPC